MPFEREYDPDDLLDLLREHDGLSTTELAERMDADYQATITRCRRLEHEGRVSSLLWGFGQQRERVWYSDE